MNICIPVEEDRGLDSIVCEHFGSTPAFLIVDTDTRGSRAILNRKQHHAHETCRPVDALSGESLDAIVVGSLGRGALVKLRAAGIRVLRAAHPTAGQTVAAFAAGQLQEVDVDDACGHHGQHHGEHHRHGIPR